jgi:hypothetical protein
LISFDVSYTVSSEEQAQLANEVEEKGVKSDRLRIPISVAEEQEIRASHHAASAEPEPVALDENTGVGMWQTVSVRDVDEEKELLEHETTKQAMVEEMNKHSQVNHCID